MASASTPSLSTPSVISPHSKAKANYKSTKLVTSGISDVATTSVHSEKTRMK